MRTRQADTRRKWRGAWAPVVPQVAPIAALAMAAALAVRLAREAPNLGGAGLLLASMCLVVLIESWRRAGREARAVARLGAITGAPHTGIAGAVAAVERHFADHEERFGHRHGLTGLPTREPLLAAMARDGGGVLGVFEFPDIERLTAFDPARADRLCITLAERTTRMAARRMVAQVDRAQFAIWYGRDAAAEAVLTELDAIRYALSSAIVDGADEILPEIRVGHALLTEGEAADTLLARAKAAVGLPVTDGGAHPLACDPVAPVRERFAIEQDLRQAVSRRELSLHFQPLIDCAAGAVFGAEALLRWHHPVRGAIPPGQFIPIMEEAGLADEIGLWVLNRACREVARWQRVGLPRLKCAVNASAHQLQRPDVDALVKRTLARHGLNPNVLEIELTESAATGDTALAGRLFDALRAQGVTIAIDDFGTGFSSLTALRALTFDKIKIDRQFVNDVDKRRDSQAICQSVIALGRGLGARVLAEGVERREEYLWLRAHGCTRFQGFYFSRPLDPDAFETFVRDDASLRDLLAVDPPAQRKSISKRLVI